MKQITKTRKAVMTLAAALQDNACPWPDALKQAWAIARKRQTTNVAGVTYGNRQTALARLETYDKKAINVWLEREPLNPHDGNAVRVIVSVNGSASYKLGYLPRKQAAILAPLLDKDIETVTKFKAVTGGFEGRETRGALISVGL